MTQNYIVDFGGEYSCVYSTFEEALEKYEKADALFGNAKLIIELVIFESKGE